MDITLLHARISSLSMAVYKYVTVYVRTYMYQTFFPRSTPNPPVTFRLTYLICSMSCCRAKLTCTASAWTHSRQKGQQNTESCGLSRPEVRRPLKQGRQNVCPHGVDTGTRVSPSSSRKHIGHSQAVRSSMVLFRYNYYKITTHR